MSFVKKTLGELCIIVKGKVGIQKAIPGEFPLVVTAEERLSHNEYHFEGNTVIIPLVSSTGHGHKSLKRIHFQTGKFAVGNILCAVMPKDETVLNAEYLYRFLDLNREKELVGRMKGMANVSLPLKEIALIEIPLPPVAEQLKFVAAYKQLETAKNKLDIELTHQLTLVKQLRQSFLREAMQGKLTADFRSAHPEQITGENSAQALLEKINAEKKQLIKDGKLKKEKELVPVGEDEIPFEIPESWVWCRLGYIADSSSGGTPNRSNSDYWGGDINWLKSGELNDGHIIIESEEKISKLGLVNSSAKLFPKGSLLIALYGATAGKLGILNFESSTNQAICGFFANQFYITKYLFYILFGLKAKIINDSWGQAQPNVSQTYLINLLIPLSPLSEQQAIARMLDELMHTCDELEASIRTSQQQNDMLLQQVLREALEG